LAFISSAAEDEQLDALHARVEKVMAPAREFWPDAGPATPVRDD